MDEVSADGLPIKLGPCSNTEFLPFALGGVERETVRRTWDEADAVARRIGVPRRRFLASLGGAALMLGVLAACHDEESRAKRRRSGGTYRIPDDAATEPEAAAGVLSGDEIIFDVQSHYLNFDLSQPGALLGLGAGFPQASCGERDARACYAVDEYLDLLFLQSDTTLTALSAIPIPPADNPLSIDDMEIARAVADRLCDEPRVLLQGGVQPTTGAPGAQIDGMAALAAEHPIAAWKVYTHAPGRGWWLDDHDPSAPQVGQVLLDEVRAVGPKIVCVHKGLAGGNRYASPEDLGPAARRNPDIAFVAYHSGFDAGITEGPYTAATADRGVNRLVKSALDAGIEPGGNVYAELGSTWWVLMRDPTQAAHVLGKLLRYLGADNILWGSDSIWYGAPQDQIQAFRAFEISEELQDRFGYPALTPEAKRKILGENALRLYGVSAPTSACGFDRAELERVREEIAVPMATLGPRTTREVRMLLQAHGGFI